MSIRIENVTKLFGGFQALSPLNLEVEKGEMIGLLGHPVRVKRLCCALLPALKVPMTGAFIFTTVM